jgi:hypothetical protein
MLKRRETYRVVLVSNMGLIVDVCVKAKTRRKAERKALRRNPGTRLGHI